MSRFCRIYSGLFLFSIPLVCNTLNVLMSPILSLSPFLEMTLLSLLLFSWAFMVCA